MTAAELAKAIGGKPHGNQFRCKCPAHEDRQASLMIRDGKDGIEVFCHAGCDFRDIRAKLADRIGEDVETVFPRRGADPGGGWRWVADYVYTDLHWNPVAMKTRLEDGNGNKRMVWTVYDRLQGKFVKSQGNTGVTDHCLYKGAELRGAIKKGAPIHVCEGEKAVDALRGLGMAATCPGHGANKFTREQAAVLNGADVIVWADIDEPGERFATMVANTVRPFAKSIRIVQSATGLNHDDAYDHFKAGYSLDEAVRRDDLVPEVGHRLVDVMDCPPEEPEYIIKPYLPKGKMVLLDADGGTGKTTFVVALAAGLSVGVNPITGGQVEPTRTLYYGTEDTPGELATIYRNCLGAKGFFCACNEKFSLTAEHLARVEDTIREGGFGLVVFDALIYYLEGVVRSTDAALDVAPTLQALTLIAQRTKATFVNIRHTGKNTVGRAAKDLGIGSVQFRNSHRGQLVMRYHPDRELYPRVRVVTHEKGSILVPNGSPFAWRRDMAGGVDWLGTVSNPFDGESEGGPRQSDVDAAAALILNRCRYVPANRSALVKEAESMGVPPSAFDLAAELVGAKTVRFGGDPHGGIVVTSVVYDDQEDPFETK